MVIVPILTHYSNLNSSTEANEADRATKTVVPWLKCQREKKQEGLVVNTIPMISIKILMMCSIVKSSGLKVFKVDSSNQDKSNTYQIVILNIKNSQRQFKQESKYQRVKVNFELRTIILTQINKYIRKCLIITCLNLNSIRLVFKALIIH